MQSVARRKKVPPLDTMGRAVTESEFIGKPALPIRATNIVTGRARYTADIRMPGMLIGRLLYSRHPRALITDLDVTDSRSLPGVRAVMTHKDIPGENSYLYAVPDQPLLVSDRVNYLGDAIVAVAADDEDSAEAALAAVKVTYEPLPGLFDPVEAMKPEAPQVLPGHSNIIAHRIYDVGDIELGFSRAAVVVENVYYTPLVEHAFLETEAAMAYLEPDGTIVVYASTQAPHRDRAQIARALGVPESEVRVIAPYVGGAFGGKDEAHVQIHAALLAQATGRPVRLLRTREESILTHVKRHPLIVRYRSGADGNGKLTAVQAVAIGDTGPYTNAGHFVMSFAAAMSSGPYYVPNARLEAYTVRTNNPICGAMRGFGAPQVTLAYEAQMDALAKALNIDPLEIRLVNGLETGQAVPAGGAIREARAMKATLREAASLSGWETRGKLKRQPAPNLRRGWGIASAWFVIGLGRGTDNAGVLLEVAPDGSVVVRTGAVDMGQGAHSALAILVADTIGAPLSSVRVIGPDTDSTVDAGPTCASRQTYVSGNAVLNAAKVVRKSLLETAAAETGLPIRILSLQNGHLLANGELLSIPWADLVCKSKNANRPLQADGFYAMEFPQEHSEKGQYFGVGPSSFGSQVAQVLVDIETGEVTLERLVAVLNAGRVISKGGASGQLVGGCVMGIGYALTEELLVDCGCTMNRSLESYLIPTAVDVPELVTNLLEIPEPYGPLGAVGIGEPVMSPTAAAIMNAVSDAIGVRMNRIPMTAERVLAAVEGRSAS